MKISNLFKVSFSESNLEAIMRNIRRFTTSLPKERVLRQAEVSNRVVVNFWSPGYTTEKLVDFEGKKLATKVFHPTTTTEAAGAYFIKKYGRQSIAKYKDDIHPGHVSIEAMPTSNSSSKNDYLSFGTTDPLNEIGIDTHHTLVHTDSFREDVLGFERFPEMRIDFYTLSNIDLNQAIMLLKENEKFYSIIGKRFGFAMGESCATGCYVCLQLAGMDSLLLPHQNFLSRTVILTPRLLIDYASTAKEQEKKVSKESIKLSDDFKIESHQLSDKFKAEIEKLKLKRLTVDALRQDSHVEVDQRPGSSFKPKQ